MGKLLGMEIKKDLRLRLFTVNSKEVKEGGGKEEDVKVSNTAHSFDSFFALLSKW